MSSFDIGHNAFRKFRDVPPSIWLLPILLAALVIRLWGAWHANLIFDERAHWALAETIDLRPGHWRLVSRTLDHPLLSIYVLRLASLLFGTSNFALRLPYVLAGTATIVPVYHLARRAFSPRAGLLAAALLAVDLFHACWSRVFMPEALMLLLSALAMLQFLRVLEKPSSGRFVLLGVLMGLAYLAKEPAILLGPAFWIYLLITPAYRPLLRNPLWYLAHVVFAAVIAPDLVWNVSQWSDSYLYRDLSMAGQTLRISLKPLSLYLGEVIRAVVDPNAFGGDYVEENMYVCHPLAGALYLTAMAATAALFDRPAIRCLTVVFLLVFIFFLVLPGGSLYDPFWWASISLIPAVVCAGGWIDRVVGAGHPLAGRVPSVWLRHTACAYYIVSAVVIAGLGLATARAMTNAGRYEERATVQDFANDFLLKGREAFQLGKLPEAERRFIYVLNIGGPRAVAYYGLAQIAVENHQPQKALRLLKKCLALDPQHAGAVELKRMLEQK